MTRFFNLRHLGTGPAPRSRILLYLLTVAVAGLVAGGCATDERLKSSEASSSLAAIDRIAAAIDSGDCDTARTEATALDARAREFAADGKLRDDLTASTAKLRELIAADCAARKSERDQKPSGPTGGVTGQSPTGVTGPTGEDQGEGGDKKNKDDKPENGKPDDDDAGKPQTPEPPAGPHAPTTDPPSGGVRPE